MDPYATASVPCRSEKSNYPLQAKKNRTFFKWCAAKMLAECKSAFPKQYKALYLFKACYLVCQGKKLLLQSIWLFLSFLPFFPRPLSSPTSFLPSPSFLPSLLTLKVKALSTTSALLFLTLTFPRGLKFQGHFFFNLNFNFLSRPHLFLTQGPGWEPSADHVFPVFMWMCVHVSMGMCAHTLS